MEIESETCSAPVHSQRKVRANRVWIRNYAYWVDVFSIAKSDFKNNREKNQHFFPCLYSFPEFRYNNWNESANAFHFEHRNGMRIIRESQFVCDEAIATTKKTIHFNGCYE